MKTEGKREKNQSRTEKRIFSHSRVHHTYHSISSHIFTDLSISFINFNKKLLCVHYVPGSLLSPGGKVGVTLLAVCPRGIYPLVRQSDRNKSFHRKRENYDYDT